MVGNNEMHLNEATMIAAVQHYFATVLFKDGKVPTVGSVKHATSSRNFGSDDTFVVKVSEPQESKT